MLTPYLLSPGTIVTIIILALLIVFTLVPDLANNTVKALNDLSDGAKKFAEARWQSVQDIWGFSRIKKREEKALTDAVNVRVKDWYAQNGQAAIAAPAGQGGAATTQTVVIPSQELANIRQMEVDLRGGEPGWPDSSDVAQAWVRRFTYLVLMLVCAASDYVLASSRTPLLFGGGTPPSWLVFAFRYLQIITGILFVTIALLSGMIIQEFIDKDLADVVKLSPNLEKPWPRVFLILAIAMFLTDIVVIVSLTIAGIAFTYRLPLDISVYFIIFIGTTIIIALALLLGFQGLLDGVMGIFSLAVLGSIALIFKVGQIILDLLAAIVGFLAWLQTAIIPGLSRQKPSVTIIPDQRDLSIVGFGPTGSSFVGSVATEMSALYGRNRYARIIGFAGASTSEKARLLRKLSRAEVSSRNMASDGLDGLMSDLIQDFSSRANDKPLLWIAYGNDLEACLPKLKASFPNQASSQARVPAAQQSAVTDVKLIILWITPSQMNAGLGNIKQVALELEKWAKEPTSPLLTTIVVEDDSPFEQAMKDRWRDLLSRSVASVLLSPVAVEGTKASFASLMQQFKDKTIPFVTLASAAIGVDSQKGAFNYGYSEGRAGEIDPRVASLRMAKLADMAFGYTKQTLWSVTDKGANPGSSPDDASRTPKGWSDQQAGTIVNIITPTQLQADEPTRRFLGAICGWLQQDYRIPAGQVTIERLLERSGEMKPSLEDTMVNLKGGHYFHFTAMRGVVNAGGTAIIPEILQGALQQGGAQPGGAPVGGVQPVVAQNPAATTP